MPIREPEPCRWTSLDDALRNFVVTTESTQSQRHIKPLHWHLACRLVIDGGFLPEDVTPKPPFRAEVVGRSPPRFLLHHDPSVATGGERVVLGGLKTKQVDVVVCKRGIGPCLALSAKGARSAFRNFANRMEEAAGDCTNLHLAYPALVCGFLVVLSANRCGPVPASIRHLVSPDSEGNLKAADTALDAKGKPVAMITRFHDALCGLADRAGPRDSETRYESIGLVLLLSDEGREGTVFDAYPNVEIPLHYGPFFERVLRAYDQRFVYFAPELGSITQRVAWDPDSPALREDAMRGFQPRLSS